VTGGGSIGLEAPAGGPPGGAAPGVAFLRIDLPPVNVLSAANLESLAGAVARARDARVLVVTGGPRVFSAGVEIAEHVPEPEAIDRMLAAMRAAVSALIRTPAVTVAEVAGACLGGGAEIAAACDLVFAAEDARIGFPEIRLACFPPAGASLLPLKVGEPRAADWILSGRSVSGREAAAAGFVSRVVASPELREETARAAAEIASRSPAAIEGALGVLRANRRRALESGGSLEAAEAAYRRLAGDAALGSAVAEWRRR
jgi:cyclohexa-1,5-dienecarbonyl-CoA hydratase